MNSTITLEIEVPQAWVQTLTTRAREIDENENGADEPEGGYTLTEVLAVLINSGVLFGFDGGLDLPKLPDGEYTGWTATPKDGWR